jgi:hypothetical protein
MKRAFTATTLLCATGVSIAASVAATVPASAPAGAKPATGASALAAACERAARNTLRETRGAAAIAVFNAAPTPAPGTADAAEVTLRGSGQVRGASGARAFSYSCTIDARNNEVAGVVLRDAGTPERTAVARPVEPDLSNVSPLACESAAAAALKQRWPGVSQIAFNAATRTLAQDSGASADLRGQGTAQPAPNSPSTHFTYHCAIDPRNGRVLATRIGN